MQTSLLTEQDPEISESKQESNHFGVINVCNFNWLYTYVRRRWRYGTEAAIESGDLSLEAIRPVCGQRPKWSCWNQAS